MLRRHRADDDVVAVGADAFEIGNAGKIDQIAGRGEPQLHRWDKAMATGEQTAVFAELGEHGDGVFNGRRSVIGESAWYHGHPPLARPTEPGSSPRPFRPRAIPSVSYTL